MFIYFKDATQLPNLNTQDEKKLVYLSLSASDKASIC